MLAPVLREDFEEISRAPLNWDALRGSRILVTGAGGLVGGLLCRFLLWLDAARSLDITVLAASRAGDAPEGCVPVLWDVTLPAHIDGAVDYIFHCAADTRSKTMTERPADVLDTLILGTRNALALAEEKKTKSAVYLSSMEVYGNCSAQVLRESDCGWADPRQARSCYPAGKRAAEALCCGWAKQCSVPVKIARLGQTFGAGVSENDSRVFAQFARSAEQGENIVLHTDGRSRGNYVSTADALLALFYMLLKGEDGELYNVAAVSMTIRELAELAAGCSSGRSRVVFDIPQGNPYGYATHQMGAMSADKLLSLGWTPRYGVEDMFKRLLRYWGKA